MGLLPVKNSMAGSFPLTVKPLSPVDISICTREPAVSMLQRSQCVALQTTLQKVTMAGCAHTCIARRPPSGPTSNTCSHKFAIRLLAQSPIHGIQSECNKFPPHPVNVAIGILDRLLGVNLQVTILCGCLRPA